MRKLYFSLFILTLAVAGNARASENLQFLHQMSDGFAEVVAQVKPGVVKITTEGTVNVEGRSPLRGTPWGDFFELPDQPRERDGQGSGVIINFSGDQYIITNNHVIRHADNIRVEMTDSRFFEAEVIGRDSLSDIAVLKVAVEDLPAVAMGDSDQLREGEWVLAIGSPMTFSHSVSTGIVSGLGRKRFFGEYGSFIQTDAAINPGNSGGALVNLHGELVGINTAIVSRSGGNIGLGFAIPINLVKDVVAQLVEHGEVRRGLLGVHIANLDPLAAETMGLDRNYGVVINEVTSGGAADKAGVKVGDVVLAIDGQPMRNLTELRDRIGRTAPGTEVELLVLRDGKEKRIKVELELRTEEAVAAGRSRDDADAEQEVLGLKVQELTDELAQRLGYEDENGVLIARVKRGSEAARRGLNRGMLIQEVGHKQEETQVIYRRQVETVEDLEDALAEIEPGDAFMMQVLGQRGTRLVGLRMPVN
ncbi:MAG: Do family serine endopeptidase [Candidatus Latescibacteria bacterium]|nr:Do family serine endopeptidase [Candidatus Latescibacterota bacterium]